MHLHMLQMHLSSVLQKTPVQKINASLQNLLQKHHHAKTVWNKVQFGSCCCRANTSCEANKFQTISKNIILTVNVQKKNSPKMLFSTKSFSTVNETCPDMMASCSSPENTKNNYLYLVRRRDLVKTNPITSASCLYANSRVKYSMHSSPNIVTAHRVYPYTFIAFLHIFSFQRLHGFRLVVYHTVWHCMSSNAN